jgi:hypothetical protein
MNNITSNCKQCQVDFTIREEDQLFYEKMNAPHPRYCWECRMQRRLAHRNERTLHRRTCDASGASMVSIYPKQTPWPVYTADEWWKDSWSATDYAQDYDPERPFFEQWQALRNRVPRIGLLVVNSVNCDYTNNAGDNKNCYLIFAADNNEDSMYSKFIQRSTQVVDCAYMYDSHSCYDCVNCSKCSHCLFSEQCNA